MPRASNSNPRLRLLPTAGLRPGSSGFPLPGEKPTDPWGGKPPSGSTPPPGDIPPPGPAKGDIKENVERAAGVINEMLEEIMRELFAENAAAYLGEEDVTVSEEDAVRCAVVSRIEILDSNFLAALNGFIQVAGKSEDEQLVNLLVMMRDEVLDQVSNRMPPLARVLNKVLMVVDKDARLEVLRTALGGGKGDVPAANAEGLLATTTQFINDIEEQTIVIDRRLLSRLCLVREEVRLIEAEDSFTSSEADHAVTFARTNVPQRCAAFLKELTLVSTSSGRVGLLNRAFNEDWEGAAPRQTPQTPDRTDQPDFVRPGRFLETVHGMEQELKVQIEQASAFDRAGQEGVLKRLGEIKMESLAVLDRLQRMTQ